jgi:transposase InsO family protein
MQSRLKGKACYKYVFRLDEKPKDAANKAEPTEAEIKLLSPWRDGDEKAFSLIRDCCEPDTLATVPNDITSAELWATLKSICSNPGAAHYAIIKMDLTHRKCADDGNVREHVAWLRQENKKLAGSAYQLDDANLALQLISTLPPRMQPLRQTLIARKVEEITFEAVASDVISSQTSEELADKVRASSTTAESSASALYGYGPMSSRSPQTGKRGKGQQRPPHQQQQVKYRPDLTCHKCGEVGHGIRFCPHNRPNQSPSLPPGQSGNNAHYADVDWDEGTMTTSSSLSAVVVDARDDQHTANSSPLQEREMEGEVHAAPSAHLAIAPPTSRGVWHIDSGASYHMTADLAWFDPASYRPVTTNQSVEIGDGRKLAIIGRGNATVLLPTAKGTPPIVNFLNVLHVRGLSVNLLSVSSMDNTGVTVSFEHGRCALRRRDGLLIASARKTPDRQYKLLARPQHRPPSGSTQALASVATASTTPDTRAIWHGRLAHLNNRAVELTFSKGMVTGVDCKAVTSSLSQSDRPGPADCMGCLEGKSHRLPFPATTSRATRPLELVHTDLIGPLRTHSRTHGTYIILITDDYSRYVWCKELRAKDGSSALQAIKEYQAMAERRHQVAGHQLQTIRGDGGGEFTNNAAKAYFAEKGIQLQHSAPYTPQQNGVAERMNRTVMEAVRAALAWSGLARHHWYDALLHAVHTRNRCFTSTLDGVTPYEAWTGRKPDVGYFHPFGCTAYAHVPDSRRTKLEPKATRCAMLGYSTHAKAYQLWDPTSRRVITSRDVTFRERERWAFDTKDNTDQQTDSVRVGRGGPVDNTSSHTTHSPSVSPPVSASIDLTDSDSEDEYDLPDSNDIDSTHRRAHRSRMMNEISSHNPPGQLELQESDSRPRLRSAAASHIVLVRGAGAYSVQIDDSNKYAESRQAEVDQLIRAGTYSLVARPPRWVNVVGCKWVDKEKLLPDGTTKHKSRLVAQGFTQRPGWDFHETYSPTVRWDSLRCLLALAAHHDWEAHHMDVKSAYLNGTLEETIYMRQPKGFEQPGSEDKVCLLHKGLYGLKQAGRAWHQTIDPALRGIGLRPLASDHCVYLHRSGAVLLIVSLYVDDLFIFTNSTQLLSQYKAALLKLYEMEDLGELRLILGVKVTRDRAARTISLSQEGYLQALLKRLDGATLNPTATPMETGTQLAKAATDYTPTAEDVTSYQSAVGGLMYAACCTRPDIAYTVSALSQYSAKPDQSHFAALKRVLRYLRGTGGQTLTYTGTGRISSTPHIVGYTDSDFANNKDDRRSVTGYAFLLCGGVISWASRRQKTVAQSTVEAEYTAAAEAVKEAVWWRAFLGELGYDTSLPLALYSDNTGCIDIAHNPEHHHKTKHIDIKYHLVREHLANGNVTLEYVATADNSADVLTKGLSRDKHQRHATALGLTQA